MLDLFPEDTETKTLELLAALDELWAENPAEKIIIFTTYLGGVETLRVAIDSRFPGTGVEVLKGGDHGAKLAAERRFRRPDGPRVLISTAAGREGINLQFARVLFNHNLPWNPMDIEQRIGRIHRYGQQDAVQVYNLVTADTIEGRVFLLLEEKIRGVAAALGKVDEHGEVTEDLRSQILGQLGERLSFSQLYQEALRDPNLRRTEQELEIALGNADRAREVVGELFQDLEPFHLEEYREIDTGRGIARLRAFVRHAVEEAGGRFEETSAMRFAVWLPGAGERPTIFTDDRDEAMADEGLRLLGLEDPMVAKLLEFASTLGAEDRALWTSGEGFGQAGTVIAVWEVRVQEPDGPPRAQLYLLRADPGGLIACAPYRLEALTAETTDRRGTLPTASREALVGERMPSALREHLALSGVLSAGATFATRLLGWLEAA